MIKEWFANKNRKYSEGIAIYNQVKKSPAKDAFFRQVQEVPPSDIHFIYLEKELQYILRVYGDVKSVSTTPTVAPSSTRSKKAKRPSVPAPVPVPVISVKPINLKNKPLFYEDRINPNELPADLRQLYEQNKTLGKEISALHAKLDVAASQPGDEAKKLRSDIKKELDSKMAQRIENWNAIDTWFLKKENGAAKPPAADPGQLIKDIKSAERYLQRNQNSTDPEVIEKCQQRIKLLKDNGIPWPPSKKK